MFTFYRKSLPEKRRAVVTGIGVVSPIGIGVADFWESLSNGLTGLDRITLFDPESFPNKIAGEVKNWEGTAPLFLSRHQIRAFSRQSQFAVAAAHLAIEDSGIEALRADRTDTIIGVGEESHPDTWETLKKVNFQLYNARIDPAIVQRLFIFAPPAAIAQEFNLKGIATTVSCACASSFNALEFARNRIESGVSDAALVGGTETAVNEMTISGMCAAGVLTTAERVEDAVLPYDLRRNGSAMGEGSCILLLETFGAARERGAYIYGEVSGYRQENENTNPYFFMDKSGRSWTQTVARAVAGQKIDVVNGHGPGYGPIDEVEGKVLLNVLGPDDGRTVPVVSFKGLIGSGMASTGSMQMAASLLMIKHQEVPATKFHVTPDPKIPLSVTRRRKKMKIQTVLTNAKAVGAANAAIVFKRVSQ